MMMWGIGRGPLPHDLGLSHPFRAVLQTDRLLKTCAWTVRFSCQGSPFHCDKRQLRALDSADGHASCPARKGICFYAPLCAVPLNPSNHLHRHSFELASLAGTPTARVMKDVFVLVCYQEAQVDFVAHNPGLMLFDHV